MEAKRVLRFTLVILLTGACWVGAADVGDFMFYAPANYEGPDPNSNYESFLNKYTGLEDGVTSVADDKFTYSFDGGSAGAGGTGYEFNGLTSYIENGNIYLMASLNWRVDMGGDGTSVIRQYIDGPDGIVFDRQVYYEPKYPDPTPGDRELYGLAVTDLDGDQYKDLIVIVKYTMENCYMTWLEETPSGSYEVAQGLYQWVGVPWHIYGVTAGHWTGQGIVELLIVGDYNTPQDSTYFWHMAITQDPCEGDYEVQNIAHAHYDHGSGDMPVFFGVTALGGDPNAVDVILGVGYHRDPSDGQDYLSRATINLPAFDANGRTSLNQGSVSGIWEWQTAVLFDAAQDQIGRRRAWWGITSIYAGVPVNCDMVWSYGQGLRADLNRDCHVNLVDFALLGGQWLECNDPQDPGCSP